MSRHIVNIRNKGEHPPKAIIDLGDYDGIVRELPIGEWKKLSILELYSKGGIAKGWGTEMVYDLAKIAGAPQRSRNQAANSSGELAALNLLIANKEERIVGALMREGILDGAGQLRSFPSRPLPQGFRDPQAGVPYRIDLG